MKMDLVEESIVNEEIEESLRDSRSSETWVDVVQLTDITDPRATSWRRYKERLSGVPSDEWVTRKYDSELNEVEVGSESLIWKNLTSQMLDTYNKLFPDSKLNDFNDENCARTSVDKIVNLYSHSIDNDVLMKNAILIDVICEPIVKKFSEKIVDVGICCASELLKSNSKTIPLNYLCGKRIDLGGTIDWVMRRYGGNRRESSMYLSLMWLLSVFMFVTCGNYGTKKAVDIAFAFLKAGILEQVTASDGDRTSHRVENTELANAVKSSAKNAVTKPVRIRLGMESVIGPRRAYKNKYNDVYKEVSFIADPKQITPTAFLTSRYLDAGLTSIAEMTFATEFGDTFKTLDGSIYLSAMETCVHYNDLSDAVMDLKYMETQNYVICAKANSNYSFSDHAEALYVALTTFDEPFRQYDGKIKRRMCRYRFANIVYFALWGRYRASERARRFVGTLSKEERKKLIERGRLSVQGEIFIEENMWLDGICSNYNNRRAEIRHRGYTETLLYLLGVEDDPSARDRVQSAVKAIGMRPFDTGLELVMSLGSVWLAQLGLRSIKDSASYDNLIADFSDFLSTLSLASLPIVSDNTITPCESICGPLCLRLIEMLAVVSEINTVAGEAIMSTVASVIGMVSLDPFRCIAYQADMLLMTN